MYMLFGRGCFSPDNEDTIQIEPGDTLLVGSTNRRQSRALDPGGTMEPREQIVRVEACICRQIQEIV